MEATHTLPARPAFRHATRVLTSVLAPLEKRCLIWMARRMPARVNSDHLTALGFVAMLGAGLSFWLASVTPLGLAGVVVCLAVNWFGDSLDGTLARVRGHERPRYGFYLDHVLDAVGTAALLGGLALSGFMTPLVAAGLLAAYFLLCIEVYLATHALGRFQMSFFGMGATELRIVLAIGAAVLAVKPTVVLLGRELLLFDVGGVAAAAGLLVTLGWSAVSNTWTLYRAEPLPGRGAR